MIRATAGDQSSVQVERRKFRRVRLSIYGRFVLKDRTEHPCQVVDMSPGGVAFRTDGAGQHGEKVIAYIDHIGRVEGTITRVTEDGFAMTIIASNRKKDKLAGQLTWLANMHELNLPEDRRHERLEPRNALSALYLTDGRQFQCTIIDLSLSGAAVEINVKPSLGAQVILGTTRGHVVRHFEDGIAVEFADLLRTETFRSVFSGDDEA